MNASERVFTAEDFKRLTDAEKSGEGSLRPQTSYWKDVWRTFKANKVALVSLIVLGLLILMVLVGPAISQFDFESNNYDALNLAPNAEHWFGTDDLGRDLWVRVWMGGRVSLLIAVLGTVIPYIIGILIGGVSGYLGGKADELLMRFIDILLSIPSLIYMILLMMVFGSGNILTLVIAVSFTGWMRTARMTRGLVLQIKENEFVVASKTLGVSAPEIIAKHLIPNSLGIIIVGMTLDLPRVIFYEAFLSFIGLGVTPPEPSWGQLIKVASDSFRQYPYQFIIPCICVSLTMLCCNLIGDGLRDAMDPKLRR